MKEQKEAFYPYKSIRYSWLEDTTLREILTRILTVMEGAHSIVRTFQDYSQFIWNWCWNMEFPRMMCNLRECPISILLSHVLSPRLLKMPPKIQPHYEYLDHMLSKFKDTYWMFPRKCPRGSNQNRFQARTDSLVIDPCNLSRWEHRFQDLPHHTGFQVWHGCPTSQYFLEVRLSGLVLRIGLSKKLDPTCNTTAESFFCIE